MNAPDQSQEVILAAPTGPTQVLAPQFAAVHPGELLRMAMTSGRDLTVIDRLMDLQDRFEANQARKAFNAAMAKFRESCVKVTRSGKVGQGPLSGTRYAKLSDFVSAVSEPLADAGLSVSWRLLQDAKDWIEVACIVRHVLGHEEQISMGGPPDTGGAKNAIQARASTVSYLEKYTLKMALGLAEQDDDDDGHGGADGDANRRTGGKPPADPPEKPAYPEADFAANFPKWEETIKSGKRTHGQIITMIETRGKLTDEQKNKIREVKANEAA